MQAKDFFGLTKEKAMQMDVKNKTIHCTALKVLDESMLQVLSACSKELQETLQMAVEVCREFAKSMNVTPPVDFTYDVGLVYTDTECKVKAAGQNWVGEYRLTKPVGVCTSNVS